MKRATVYSTPNCPYCYAAKNLLSSKGVEFQEFDVSRDSEKRKEMLALSTERTVPQIVIDGQHIGGYTDLAEYLEKNQPSRSSDYVQ